MDVVVVRRVFLLFIFLLLFCPSLFSESSAAVQDLLTNEPNSLILQIRFADSLGLEGKYSAALHVLENLLPPNPQNPVILGKIGYYQFYLGQYEKAMETFKDLLRCQPYSLDARYGLVRVFSVLLDWDRVETLCHEILKIDPNNFFACLNIGWAEFNLKNFSGAYDWYNAPAFRTRRRMSLGRGWCLVRLKRFEEAKIVFQELCLVFPYDTESLNAFKEADLLSAQKDLSQVGWVTILTPEDMERYLEFAKKSRLNGKLDDALKLVALIVDRNPKHLEAILEMARIYSELGNWEKADFTYSIYLNQKKDIEGLAGKILALRYLGRFGDASKFAAELLELDKTSVIANLTLGDYHYQIGEFEKALFFYNQSSIPTTLILQGKGWSQLNLKKVVEARITFESILAREPANQNALEGLKEVQNRMMSSPFPLK